MNAPAIAKNLKIGAKILMLVATAALGLSVVVGLTLMFVYDEMKADRITSLKWVVETAHGIASKLDERVQAGEMTREQAIAELGRIATGMRYSNNEYLFAYTFDSTNVFHVAKPQLAGVNQDDLTDPTGFHPIRALSEVARTQGEGVVPYMWPKAGSDVPVAKFSYVKAFKPWGLYIGTGVYMDEFERDYSTFRTKMLLGSLIVLVLTAALALVIGRNISEPTKRLAAATRALAGGDLEANVPDRDRGDEIGELADAVQVFKDMAVETEKLRLETQDLLQQSQEMNAEQVRLQKEADDARTEAARREEEAAAEKRADILNLANAFEGDIGSIVGTLQTMVEEMVAASGELSSTTETSSNECDMVAASAEEASVNVQTVASAAEELTASIREISRQLADSRQASTQAVDMINSTDTAVSALADQAEQISRITKLITDIAEQTNLLALNATIEAARAGEAGRGFTVVASEVKALATQTARAATEIGQQIVSVQGNTEATVESIRGVRKLIHDNDGVTGAIAAAVEEQGAATQEIVRNIQEAASGTADVSERIQKIQSLAKSVEANAQTAGEVSARLGQTCDTLDSSATRFVTHMRSE